MLYTRAVFCYLSGVKGLLLTLTVLLASWAIAQEPALPSDGYVKKENTQVKEFQTVSSSKHFIVTGKDRLVNNALATKSDQIRAALNRMLSFPDEWKHQIALNLYGDPGTPSPPHAIRSRLSIIAGSPHYEINIHVGRGIDLDDLRTALVTMLVYERALRSVDLAALPEEIALPPWLLVGLEQALLWSGETADRSLYAALFDRGGILPPETILKQEDPERELDSASYLAYKASCGAMMLCLLNQKKGAEAVNSMLNESVLGSADPLNLITRNFPQLNLSSSSLHKWWTLQLSSMATPAVSDCMSLGETERRLAEALILMSYDPETRRSTPVSFDDIQAVLKITDWKDQLTSNLQQLSRLSVRCFPSYSPLILEYSRLMMEMRKGLQPSLVEKGIKPLKELRVNAIEAATRARDYLDWYEITHRTNTKSSFNSYKATLRLLRTKKEVGTTPISRYLDDIEALHSLPAMAPLPVLHGAALQVSQKENLLTP